MCKCENKIRCDKMCYHGNEIYIRDKTKALPKGSDSLLNEYF